MAYCIYCGKKLEEGENCNCRSVQNGQDMQNSQNMQNNPGSQNSQNMQNNSGGQSIQNMQNNLGGQSSQNIQNSQDFQNNQSNINRNGAQQPEAGQAFNQNQGNYYQAAQPNRQQYQEGFNQAKEVSGIYLQQLSGAVIGILKKPVTQGKAFAASGNAQLGVGFLVIQAILSSLFALVICSKINALGNMTASLLGGGDSNILSYPKTFLLTIVGSLIISFVFAGLLYLGVILFRGKTTFGQMICVAAVRSVGVSIFLVLSIIVGFLNIGWGFAVFMLSWLTGLFFTILVIQTGAECNSNVLPYIIIFAAILSIVVFFSWSKISLPMYASELVDELEDVIDSLTNLGSL